MNLQDAQANAKLWDPKGKSVPDGSNYIIVGKSGSVVEGWHGLEAAERNCEYLNAHAQKTQGEPHMYHVEPIEK